MTQLVDCPRNSRNSLNFLFAGTVLLSVLLLQRSFFKYFILTDYDAASFLAFIRLHDVPFEMKSSYTLQSLTVWCAGQLTRGWTGLPPDYLMTWRHLLALCVTGSAALIFAVTFAWTRSLALCTLATLLYALNPAVCSLTIIGEDNLFSSFFHLAFLVVYLGYVQRLRQLDTFGIRMLGASLVFCLLFGLALLAHRQHVVLFLTILALPLFVPPGSRRRALRLSLMLLAGCLALFLMTFAGFTVIWDGHFSWSGYWGYCRNWFLPPPAYRPYYFYHQSYWDGSIRGFGIHFVKIVHGIRQIVAYNRFQALPLAIFLTIVAFYLNRAVKSRNRQRDVRLGMLYLFALIHVPHSLVYEPWNVERWDILVPVLILLGALLVHFAGHGSARRWGLAAGLLVLICQAIFLGFYRKDFDRIAALEVSQSLARKLRYTPPNNSGPILVLSPEEFDNLFTIAATHYDFRWGILLADPQRGLCRSVHDYADPQKLTPREIQEHFTGKAYVLSRQDQQTLNQLCPSLLAPGRYYLVD